VLADFGRKRLGRCAREIYWRSLRVVTKEHRP
jgi:hypothetical protein